MPTVPFVEDTLPSLAPAEAKSVEPRKTVEHRFEQTSLSYDQVNDNAEELVELRGEGRYFGVTDPEELKQPLGPLCDNCHKRGHSRYKCKTVVCHKCGIVDDHYENQCPTTVVCLRCGERGHISSNCKSKTRKRQYCKACDSSTHSGDKCPAIWRLYITKAGAVPESLPRVCCYNCGSSMHLGDECPKARVSRYPNKDGSAFSGLNLPKNLRSLYYDKMKQSARVGSSKDYVAQPTRSGFLTSKTAAKKASLPKKPVKKLPSLPAKPNRTGLFKRR